MNPHFCGAMRVIGPSKGMSLECVKLHQALTIWLVILATTWTFVTCRRTKECKTNDINVTTYKGARIEPYEKSRIEVTLGEPANKRSKRLLLSFEFRTTSGNGTLFYGRSSENPTEVIGLMLRGGQLLYKIQCPSLYADVMLSAPGHTSLNDNQWHTVHFATKFGRQGQRSVMKVDGQSHPQRYEMNCERFTSLVLGGHSPGDNATQHAPDLMSSHGHFEGCIRKLDVSYPLRTLPKYYAVSQCD